MDCSSFPLFSTLSKRSMRPLGWSVRRRCTVLACATGLLYTASASVMAQQSLQPMSDPNPLCLDNAVDFGTLVLPTVIDGALEGDPVESRLDFYRFDAAPGTDLEVRMQGASSESGTLPDPFLGLFDDRCRLLTLNDDSDSLDSLLRFSVPDSGTVILAAAKYPDSEFNGSSGPSRTGSYRLSITASPPLISAIRVRLVDSLSGEPIPGDIDPFAYAELYRCDERDCIEYVAAFNANSQGQVVFDGNAFPSGLTAGTYLIRARATDYGSNESGRFSVAGNESFEVWDITLSPPPIAIGRFSLCDDIPPQGGTCTYDVQINNNTGQPLTGLAWSTVDGYNLGRNDNTRFEASTGGSDDSLVQRAQLQVADFSATTVQFRFDVPSFAPEGAQFCQSIYIGLDPGPLYNLLEQRQLFCIEKRGNVFRSFDGPEMSKAGIEGDQRSIEQRRLSQGMDADPAQ